MPVELTESAKKKLPAAIAARKKRAAAGGLGNINKRQGKQMSALDEINEAIKKSNRSGR